MKRERVILALLYAAGSLGLALYALHAGQDFNFDRLNYHDYIAWNLFHAPFLWNMPGNYLQAWLNPLPQVPAYLANRHLPPQAASALIAAIQGLGFGMAVTLALRLLKADTHGRWWLAVGAGVIGITGPMTLSEAGTTYVDSLTGLLPMAALLFLVGREKTPRAAAAAALLVGMAVGLKTTNAIYAVGLAGFLVGCGGRACGVSGPTSPQPSPEDRRGNPGGDGSTDRIKWAHSGSLSSLEERAGGEVFGIRPWLARLSAAAAGGLAGILITGGWWYARLWHGFGNPMWPYLDGLFHGQSGMATLGDTRFLPRGFWEAVLYPLLIAIGIHPSSEVFFLDARWLVLGVLLLGSVTAGLLKLRRSLSTSWPGPLLSRPSTPVRGGNAENQGATAASPSEPALLQQDVDGRDKKGPGHDGDGRGLMVFLTGVWLSWLVLFGIERFLSGLEMLSGVLLLAFLIGRIPTAIRGHIIMAGVLILWARIPDLGRQGWSEAGYRINIGPLAKADNALIILDAGRYDYLIPYFPPGVRVIGIRGAGSENPAIGLGPRIQTVIRDHQGPIWWLGGDHALTPAERAQLAHDELLADEGACRPVTSRFDHLRACPLAHKAGQVLETIPLGKDLTPADPILKAMILDNSNFSARAKLDIPLSLPADTNHLTLTVEVEAYGDTNSLDCFKDLVFFSMFMKANGVLMELNEHGMFDGQAIKRRFALDPSIWRGKILLHLDFLAHGSLMPPDIDPDLRFWPNKDDDINCSQFQLKSLRLDAIP